MPREIRRGKETSAGGLPPHRRPHSLLRTSLTARVPPTSGPARLAGHPTPLLPFSVHVYRRVWCNVLIFFHNAAIFVVVAVLFSIWPGWTGLLAVPGFVLLCLNGIWVGLLLGIVSARFRDVPPIVASLVRILFFVTPIIWMPELMPGRALMLAVVLDFNPFFHFVELVRAPLLGQAPGLVSWVAASGITLGGWLLAFESLRRYRRRIAYWV